MLLLFAVSITPRQILHNIITGHKHSYAKFDGAENFKASKGNFQCNWHNEVIESPFTNQPDFQIDSPVITYSSHNNHYTLSYYSTEHFFSSLRGPPSLV
jgi:hypothetical protein